LVKATLFYKVAKELFRVDIVSGLVAKI